MLLETTNNVENLSKSSIQKRSNRQKKGNKYITVKHFFNCFARILKKLIKRTSL